MNVLISKFAIFLRIIENMIKLFILSRKGQPRKAQLPGPSVGNATNGCYYAACEIPKMSIAAPCLCSKLSNDLEALKDPAGPPTHATLHDIQIEKRILSKFYRRKSHYL